MVPRDERKREGDHQPRQMEKDKPLPRINGGHLGLGAQRSNLQIIDGEGGSNGFAR